MVEKTLVMGFENELGKKFSLRVKSIKSDLTPVQIKTAMDTVLEKDVFITTGGKLVKKLEAEIVTEEISKIELV